MGRIVIVAYKPKEGKEVELRALVKTHVSTLRSIGLVTEREAVTMQSTDGSIVEVFEWVSEQAIEQAHTNATVLQMWEQFSEVAEFLPIAEVPEAAGLFSEFSSLD